MNQVQLTGRLVRDPQLRTANNGKSFCAFNLAVSSFSSNGQDYTNYISCFAWEKTAENLVKYQSKGSLIAVEGSLAVRSNKKDDGTYDNQMSVSVQRIEFLGSKNDRPSSSVEQNYDVNNFERSTTGFDFEEINNFAAENKAEEKNSNSNTLDDSDSILWD
ncbi:single-stranded DNA-binding protein [Spiroplasma endosymbiont of Labia minor]|uniref:single-stranded DNA-binding protein n=1 Tax=Spiroplasma endosymbiont of Labia minor TaxID=3066305 RepID=UPI0030CCE2AE